MPRAKTVVPGRARRRKVLKKARGNYSGRRKLYKSALQTVQRAGQFAYEHRRLKKRDFRRLWIVRINAAARINGLTYSTLIAGLKKANVDVNRKLLADLAVRDAAAFAKFAEVAKSAVA
ncbi:MAG: 50S ribosomal protein L20 [Candidatus Eisenbacteria bacterium]|nr:50S ribosomal protein L20 [Candidatus Eisenbacteria bacterium]